MYSKELSKRTRGSRLCLSITAILLIAVLFLATTMEASAAEIKTAVGTVDASGLRFRDGPSLTSAQIGTAYRNDKVIVVSVAAIGVRSFLMEKLGI